jgi:hypothetical protein
MGDYPCGPYGFAQGATIANLTFAGRRDDDHDGTAVNDPIRDVSLDEYLDRDGVRKALVIVIASETCVPCQNEQPMLVELEAHYAGTVAFLEGIVQGQAGQPATQQTIDAWAAQFGVPFDMTADPTGVFKPYYDASAFPATIVIRTGDMQIQTVLAGNTGDLQPLLDTLVFAF